MINIKKFQYLLCVVSITVASAVTHAQGIPVYDGNAHISALEQMANTVKQLTEMGKQLSVMNSQLDAIKGSRGMGMLLSNENHQYLPENWSDIANLASSGVEQYSNLAQKIKTINDNNAVLTANQLAQLPADIQALIASARNLAAIQSAIADTAYSNASARMTRLQSLVNAVDSTTDVKAVSDLQARIQSEQAMIQTDAIKLAQATQLQQADQRLFDQQCMERLIQMGGSSLSNSSVVIKAH